MLIIEDKSTLHKYIRNGSYMSSTVLSKMSGLVAILAFVLEEVASYCMFPNLYCTKMVFYKQVSENCMLSVN